MRNYDEFVKEASISDSLINNSTFSQVKPGGTMIETKGSNLAGEVKNMFNKEQKLMSQAGVDGRYNGPIAKSIRKHVYNNPGNTELKNRITGLKKDGVSFSNMSDSLRSVFKQAYEEIMGMDKEATWESNLKPVKPNVSNNLVGAGADRARKLQSKSYLSDMKAKERAGFMTKKPSTFWNDMF